MGKWQCFHDNIYTTAGSQTLSGTKLIASNGALADKIDANSQVQIDVYMFYDGADANYLHK